MEPRPIEPKSIRAGDRVRYESERGGIRRTFEFTVAVVYAAVFATAEDGRCFRDPHGTWTLLDRPREVGSRWRDPETGALYVKTDHPEYLRYKSGHVGADARLDENCTNDRATIARLVPVDGAS